MKLYKKVFIFLGICFGVYLIYMIILLALAFGHQRMPQVDVPEELKKLEKIIKAETNGGTAKFLPMQKHKIENCDGELYIYIYINNDSITKSKELLDIYINSVNKRVSEILIDKKCINSLIIDVSAFYSKGNKNSQSKNYHYSFPIKE